LSERISSARVCLRQYFTEVNQPITISDGPGCVEDRQIRLLDAGQPDRLGAVGSLRDDGQVGFAVEDQPEAAAYDRVVVGQQDPGHRDLARTVIVRILDRVDHPPTVSRALVDGRSAGMALEPAWPADDDRWDDADVVMGIATLVADPPAAEVYVNLHSKGAIRW
jgi:hypothetical protein